MNHKILKHNRETPQTRIKKAGNNRYHCPVKREKSPALQATPSFSLFITSPLIPLATSPQCLPTTTTAGTGAADGGTATGHADTAAAKVAAAEHGRIAEHVWDDEEAHVGAADVDLVEVGDAAVAGRHGDVLELDVHIVFGCYERE